jgi:hypothetical protein
MSAITLNNPHIPSVVKDSFLEALRKIGVTIDDNPQISFRLGDLPSGQQRIVEIGTQGNPCLTRIIYLSDKKLSIGMGDFPREIDGKLAREARKAIKELRKFADVLIDGDPATPTEPRAVFSSSLTPTPRIDTLNRTSGRALLIADLNGVLRNLLDLIQITVAAAGVLKNCVAALRIVQGSLNLLMGIIRLITSIYQYRQAIRLHDTEGAELAKKRIVSAFITLALGCLWIGLGVAFIACPQIMMAGTIAYYMYVGSSWALFYGCFSVDSIFTWIAARRTMSIMEEQYRVFKVGILENKALETKEKKEQAAHRFAVQVLQATPKSQGQKYLLRKQGKKELAAQRIGITPELLQVEDGTLVKKIKQCFDEKIAEQKAAIFLSQVSLVMTLLGLPLELSTVGAMLNVGSLTALTSIHLAATYTALVILWNALFVIEDGPSWISGACLRLPRLKRKIFSGLTQHKEPSGFVVI